MIYVLWLLCYYVWQSVETGIIHGETDLIRYAAKFSAEVYKIMIAYVWKSYDINM